MTLCSTQVATSAEGRLQRSRTNVLPTFTWGFIHFAHTFTHGSPQVAASTASSSCIDVSATARKKSPMFTLGTPQVATSAEGRLQPLIAQVIPVQRPYLENLAATWQSPSFHVGRRPEDCNPSFLKLHAPNNACQKY